MFLGTSFALLCNPVIETLKARNFESESSPSTLYTGSGPTMFGSDGNPRIRGWMNGTVTDTMPNAISTSVAIVACDLLSDQTVSEIVGCISATMQSVRHITTVTIMLRKPKMKYHCDLRVFLIWLFHTIVTGNPTQAISRMQSTMATGIENLP